MSPNFLAITRVVPTSLFGSALAARDQAGSGGLLPSERTHYSLRAAQVGQRLAQALQEHSASVISTLAERI